MRRALVVTIGETGHVNPLMPVVERLVRDGLEVGWICLGKDPPPALARSSAALLPLPRPVPRWDEAPSSQAAGDPGAARDIPYVRRIIEVVPEEVAIVAEVVERFRPDVLAIDPYLHAAAIAAERARLPYLGVATNLEPVASASMRPETALGGPAGWAWINAALEGVYGEFGLSVRLNVGNFLSPHGTTVFATEALVGDPPPGVFLVGPSIPLASRGRGEEVGFPWDRLDERPLLYIAFGTQVSYQVERARRALRAAAPLGCQIVLASADLARSPLAAELSERALLVDYAPQPELLARARAFVTHGGANSVSEALVAGTPMLVSPVDLDQFFQAHFVPASGAGLTVDLLAAPEEEVRAALEALLAEKSPYRARALEMAEEYRRRDGAGEVARLLEGLLSLPGVEKEPFGPGSGALPGWRRGASQ
jgi:hypothetical protein